MSMTYELLCILPGTLGEDEVPQSLDVVKKALTDNEATDLSVHDLGKNRLAYPMKHIRYGYIFQILFTSEPEQLPTIQSKLRLLTEPLRLMIHKYDEQKQKGYEERMADIKVRAQKHAPDAAKSDAGEAEKEEKTEAKAEKTEEVKKSAEKETKAENVSVEDIEKKLDQVLDQSLADA